MILVIEKNGVLYIHRKGRQRVVLLGTDKEIVCSYLRKLHDQHKIMYVTQDASPQWMVYE